MLKMMFGTPPYLRRKWKQGEWRAVGRRSLNDLLRQDAQEKLAAQTTWLRIEDYHSAESHFAHYDLTCEFWQDTTERNRFVGRLTGGDSDVVMARMCDGVHVLDISALLAHERPSSDPETFWRRKLTESDYSRRAEI